MTALRRLVPAPLRAALRRRVLGRRIEMFPTRDRTGTYGGVRLTVRIADPLAAGWYEQDWPVLPEVAKLRELGVLTPDATVFDLGAHQGVVAMMLAAEVGRVVAVEAEPHNARIAAVNRERNNAGNVEIVHAAVADVAGTIAFTESLNGRIDPDARWGTVDVPALDVDTLAERHGAPDVLFVDVEGFEGKALAGARRTLPGVRGVFVEVHVGRLVDTTAEQVVATFDGWDRWIAEERGGDDHVFAPYAGGPLPERRFFLVAVRASP